MRRVRAFAVAFLCASVVGCAPGSKERGADRATKTGWTETLVLEKLRGAGLRPVAKDTVRQPFLSVTGKVYDVSGSNLQLFVYNDGAALERDVSRLDPVRVSPPTMMISWIAPPTLIVSGNLAAILISKDEILKETVKRALNVRQSSKRELQ